MPRKKTQTKKLRVTYVKSSIGYAADQKKTVLALGLKHLGDKVEKEDSPVVRGMIFHVQHLVQVEEL
jgi:large subunit ribosomal protein L30